MWKWFKNSNSDKINETEFEEDDDEIRIRKPIEVAERILALLAVIGKVYQGNDPKFTNWFHKNLIERYLSNQETIFINTEFPKKDTIRDFSWRAEALTSLLWGVNLINEMPILNKEFDIFSINEISEIINNPKTFKKNMTLRTDAELNEMENKLYNQHWRVRDAQLFGKEMPSELNPSIVYERRYGLNWLVGWGDNWDDVPTDT